MTDAATSLIDLMFELKTFQVRADDPVTWASGAVMPVYNDNRRLLSDSRARSIVSSGMTDIVASTGLRVSGVVGTATGGMAPAVTLADRLGLRFFYVRSGAKGHGLGRLVEGLGVDDAGLDVVLVEDLVSTGGSSAAAADAVHRSGLGLSLGIAVFSYGFPRADRAFAELDFPFRMHALVHLDDLLEHASVTGALSPDDIDTVRSWQAAPFSWARTRGIAGHVC